MAYNESNERPTRSCCEKIHEAIFGKLNHSSRYPNKNVVTNPSLSTNDYPTPKPYVSSTPFQSVPHEVKPSKDFVHFSLNNVDNNGDVGRKTFSEEEYNSYIDGMKMKMGAPSNVGGEMSVSMDDSFNNTVSTF
ncbi:hypothetical protein L1887_13224 [Cichorium endivia]|nr:hypothetical protein L1887_13224 [Cichorium endivia]